MLRYVSALAVAVLAVMATSPVSAEHCKGKHKDDPGCNGGGGGGIVEPPVVVDSTDAVVGQADLGTTNTNVGAAHVLLRLDDGRLVTLLAEPGDLRGTQLNSESEDCAEPLFFTASGAPLVLMLPRASVGPNDMLYVQTAPSAFDTVDIVSSIPLGDGNCVPNVMPTRSDAIRADPVMQLNFVPPFHIE